MPMIGSADKLITVTKGCIQIQFNCASNGNWIDTGPV